MSIVYDNYEECSLVECDNCGETLEDVEGDFQGVVDFAKENEWKIRPNHNGIWFHYCSQPCLLVHFED